MNKLRVLPVGDSITIQALVQESAEQEDQNRGHENHGISERIRRTKLDDTEIALANYGLLGL